MYDINNITCTVHVCACFDRVSVFLQHPVTNKLHSLSSVITKSQLVEIVEPVVVLPKVLMLLSDKKSEQVYQHTMKVQHVQQNH